MFFQFLSDFEAEFPEAEDFQQSWKTVATNILDIVRTTSTLKSIEEVKLIINAQPSVIPAVGVQTVEGKDFFFLLKLYTNGYFVYA